MGTEPVQMVPFNELSADKKAHYAKLHGFHCSMIELEQNLGATDARIVAYYEGLAGLGARGYGPLAEPK